MELSLVDISPKSAADGRPDAGLPALEFPVVEAAPTPPRDPQRANSAPLPGSGLQRVDPEPVQAPASAVELRLVEDGPVVAAAAPAASQEIDLVAFGTKRALAAIPDGAAAAAAADPLLAEALHEYQNGNIDLPLWTRALAQHEGDQSQAVAGYLQARATALKLERRNRRVADPAPPMPAAVPAARPMPLERDDDEDDYALRKSQHRAQTVRRFAILAAPVAVALVIGVWWMISTSDRDSAQASLNATAAAPAKTQAPAVPTPTPVHVTTEEDPGIYFAGKILDLKSAGNWNVLVLFASEWTRKQPGSALAWKELSVGYSNMRQYSDALEAGTKATKLAPDDPLVWRNLAQVHLDLKESEAALKAFERASVLDPTDVFSQLQIGTISAQLGHLPQARTAFEQVLAADPDNPDALCGTVAVAQKQGRGKDADAIAKQVRGTDQKCRDTSGAVAVATRK